MIRDTSRIAYLEKYLPQLPERQREVLQEFAKNELRPDPDIGLTNLELQKLLRNNPAVTHPWHINSVTSTVFGLKQDQLWLDELPGKRQCRVSGNLAIACRLIDPPPIQDEIDAIPKKSTGTALPGTPGMF